MSNNELAGKKKTAVLVSSASAIVMLVITLYMGWIAAEVIGYTFEGWGMIHARAAMAFKSGMAIGRVAIYLLFALFFWKCGHGETPFGVAQSALLFIAGLLVVLYGFIGQFGAYWVNSLPEPMYLIEPISTDFDYPGTWLLFVAFGLFLVCLSVVFRYGRALFEDTADIL